ncbi:hypothetical protein SAMN05216389_10129 [Oceanobacillus limi]|uniref:ABC-2 family transporter protein n=1 Tax=Oceanobacillus limi TaxID=930131 RepID=A0A1H9XZD8_9BACI|nr:hypothetical protein [Oceanobacillus limi]SES61747.1 hypothetical protein SAMN05216389_10129 [Oceanobacillus limi]
MFWKYTRFEAKLVTHNRKIWFVSAFLMLFFLLFFMYYQQDEPPSLVEQKRVEKGTVYSTFDYLDNLRHDVPEVAEVYDHMTEISSLVNFQVWYIGQGDDSEQYIENGLEANELRLKVHELGNEGIPDHLIMSREDILKDTALLQYIKDKDLPIESDSFATNHYYTKAIHAISGLLFLVIVLIAGNELLVYEQRHRTIMRGFPIAFLKKVSSKVSIHFVLVYTFLLLGFVIGSMYVAEKFNAGEFSFPVLIYKNEGYVAVSTQEYLLYIFLGFALVTVFLLFLSILLNMLFKNAFANILVGLSIYLLPDLFMAAGFKATFFHPLKYIDIANVLSGDLAVELGNRSIDYGNAMISLGGMTILLIGVIYAINRFTYIRVPKDAPLEKAF